MIEAELKARVRRPEELARRLRMRAREEVMRYTDTYYDWPDSRLGDDDREFRIRRIRGARDTRYLLTFKDAAVEALSESKPEYESEISCPEAVEEMLLRLGLRPFITFEKHCRNYRVEVAGTSFLATVVRVPEIADVFIEVETLIDDDANVGEALEKVRALMSELGIRAEDLTRERYIDGVRKARLESGEGGGDL